MSPVYLLANGGAVVAFTAQEWAAYVSIVGVANSKKPEGLKELLQFAELGRNCLNGIHIGSV